MRKARFLFIRRMQTNPLLEKLQEKQQSTLQNYWAKLSRIAENYLKNMAL